MTAESDPKVWLVCVDIDGVRIPYGAYLTEAEAEKGAECWSGYVYSTDAIGRLADVLDRELLP